MTLDFEICHYLDRAGRNIFAGWLSGLRDYYAKAKIAARIDRMATGNFGDCKALGQGVYELRIAWGPGYRIYYAIPSKSSVLLLCGGDKRKQSADIERAIAYLKDYKARTEAHETQSKHFT